MHDQAEVLRAKLVLLDHQRSRKAIAVVSGKGGVGKSNFSLNFAISLSKRGFRILLFDMDIGMGNLDILMGSTPDYSIVDYLADRISLQNTIMKGPDQIDYIAGGSGLAQLVELEESKLDSFIEDLNAAVQNYDYLIFDMGAGVQQDSLRFLLSVNEVFVVTTPEPTAITDAYAMMKYVHLMDSSIPLYVVVNRAESVKDGTETIQRLTKVMSQFLGRRLNALGVLPDDKTVETAVRRQVPFLNFNEKSPVSRSLIEITDRYLQPDKLEKIASNGFHFVSKLKRFLFERQ